MSCKSIQSSILANESCQDREVLSYRSRLFGLFDSKNGLLDHLQNSCATSAFCKLLKTPFKGLFNGKIRACVYAIVFFIAA